MKTFRANSGNYIHKIDEHEVIKETVSFIVISLKSGREFRESKESSGHKHFSTYNEAKQWLMDKLDIQIKNAQAQVDRLKSQKQKVDNL